MHSSKSTYTITVDVRDSEDKSGQLPARLPTTSIEVTINVFEGPVVSGLSSNPTYAENDTQDVAQFDCHQPRGAARLNGPLEGDDAGDFTIAMHK